MAKELLGRQDVASILGVSVRTLSRYVKLGTFPRGKLFKGRVVWNRFTINKWLKENAR